MEWKIVFRLTTTKLFAFVITSFFILFTSNVLAIEDSVIITPDTVATNPEVVVTTPELTVAPNDPVVSNPSPVVDASPALPLVPESVVVEPDTTSDLPVTDNNLDKKTISQNALTGGEPVGTFYLEPRNSVRIPDSDLITGALVEEFPFNVPPGRNGMQPDLKLKYNNQDTDNTSIFGYGWSVNIPYIQRISRYGVNKLYTGTSTFYSSLSDELVASNTNTYFAKVENGNFIKYTFASNTWVATDKKGTIYKFGMGTSTQQYDLNFATHTYKWMLQEVRDKNDNYIKYQYFLHNGQIYPLSIFYTGNSTTDGNFTISFSTTTRSDILSSYKTGFKVVSSYKINEINIKIGGVLTRKYTLDYTTGVNSLRALLRTITDQGHDESGSVVSLPQTVFTYSTSTAGFSQDSDWQSLPSALTLPAGAIFADVNGDGLQDLNTAWGYVNDGPFYSNSYLNSGNKYFVSSTTFGPSTIFASVDQGTRIVDLNGDGYSDIIHSFYTPQWQTPVWSYEDWNRINSTTAWRDNTSNWVLPHGAAVYRISWAGTDSGLRLVDFNGDGLVDALVSGTSLENSGYGFVTSTNSFSNIGGTQGMIADVNGDGLPDIIVGDATNGNKVYLNTSTGFIYDSTITQPLYFISGSQDTGVRVADVNGDGLPDFVQTLGGAYLGTGAGWSYNGGWVPPYETTGYGQIDVGVQLIDINGDGVSDYVKSGPISYSNRTNINGVWVNNTNKLTDQLISVKYSSGGTTLIDYKTTQFYKNDSNLANPNLPLVLNTVSQIKTIDGLGTTNSSSFKYEGGKLYYGGPFNRKFAGFNKVTKTDSSGNYTVTFYHQGDTSDSSHGEYNDSYYKINKPYRVETYDANGSLFTKNINKWDEAVLSTSSRFVFSAQNVDYSYDGGGSHKDKAQSFTYNTTSTGNLIQKIDWGEVSGNDDGSFSDTGTDSFTTNYSYAINTSSYILGLPSDVSVVDYNAIKVKQDRYYYDTSTLGVVVKGNMTKQESWQTSTTYINNQKIYNTYGLVTSDIDAKGNTTTYSYDSYNLYSTTTTDPMAYKLIRTFDYSNGKPKQIIDQNNLKYQTIFDGLDRVVAVLKPDLTTTSTLVTSTAFDYASQPIGWQIKQTDYLNSVTTTDSYSYTDGLDRTIQKRKRADDSGNYSVMDTVYGSRGQVEKESLPYFSYGTASTTATTTQALFKTYWYDPLLRLAVTIDSVGTTTNSYDRWKLTVTDANGNSKNLYKDAYGNLVKVEEINNGSTYTTNYTYNGLGNLISITDASNNVRNFIYDGLGRRIGMEDLHVSGDTTFGTSTFAYDNNGNLTQKIDPNKQTVNYTYDKLNRVLTEDFTGKSGTEVTYGYDKCAYGIGKLCSATSTGAIVNNVYDGNENLKQETKKINNVNYVTQYSYDRLGNSTNIIYPDNSQVQYVYSSANRQQAVNYKESTGSFKSLINSISYSPLGQTVQITYPSGVTTTFTYDANKLYRLINKITSLPTSSVGYYGEGLIPGAYYQISTSTSGVVGGPTPARNMTVNGLTITQSMTYDDSFEGALLGVWKYWSATGTAVLDCTTSYTGSCSQKVTVPTGGNVWDSQLWQDLRVDNGTNYTVKFRAKSSATTTMTFGINQDHSPWSDYGLATGITTTPSWKQFSYSFTSNGTDELARVFFYAGARTSTFWFDDVEVIPDTQNKIKNQSFETGNVNWNFSTNSSTQIIDCTNSTDGACSNKINVVKGGQPYQTQISENLSVNTSTAYIITFDAKTSTNTTQTVVITQNHSPYTDLSWSDFITTPNWKSYLFEVTPSQGDSNAKLAFYLGRSTSSIWIDNVRVWSKQATKITSTPQFSALYESTNTSTSATNYQIQITQSGLDFSSPFWDSGTQTLSSSTPVGIKSPNIAYTGPIIASNGMKYFWRIKFWDNLGNEGAWTNGRDYFYAPGIAVQNLSYSYDKVGIITQILDNSSTSTSKLNIYGYDNLNRLISAKITDSLKVGDYTQTYSYDALGNITNKSDIGSYSYLGYQGSSYANPDAVTGIGTTTFNYDKNGNMTSSSANIIYNWDYRNQLATSTVSRVTSTYLYDQDGNRVMYRKLGTGGITTTYANKYYSVVGTTTIKQFYLGDTLIATVKGSNASSSVYNVHTDQLGGSNIMTTASGTIAELTDYYPYGGIRLDEQVNGFNEPNKFTGYYFDAETALNYAGARYQDGVRGQFTSQDPTSRDYPEKFLTDPQQFNYYSYARNNPIVNTDPDGKVVETITDIGFTGYDISRYLYNESRVISSLFQGNLKQADKYNSEAMSSAFNTIADAGSTLIPFVPAGIVRAENTSKIINKAANVLPSADNYRALFEKTYGKLKEGVQVHHSLPQKYEKLFKDAGVNIHEMKNLEAVPRKIHEKITATWRSWDKVQGGNINVEKVQNFANQVQKEFSKYFKVKK